MIHQETLLDGIWTFTPDPFDEGDAVGYRREDYDARGWAEAPVPSTFDASIPSLASYEGIGWFRRRFFIPKEWRGTHLRLRFGAVNYTARVYINGNLVGDNPDGFLPFDCDITDVVKYGGENTLTVRVDNTRRADEVPGIQRGWRPYGGILRSVKLVACDPLHIATTRLNAWPDGTFTLNVSIENARAETANVTLDLVIEDDSGNWRGAFMETGVIPGRQAHELRVSGRVTGVVPWSPETPTLYKARLRLRDAAETPDRREFFFGFRRIEVVNGRIHLNGQPILLIGFNRHEDTAGSAMVANPAMARQDLQRIKECGANFVRLCHYPHDEATLDFCDQIGLLTMAEIPLYWWGNREEDQTVKLANARRQLTRLIERDANHPSLIFWSVSNETEERHAFVAAGNADLVRLAKQLDPSRLAVHVSHSWTDHPHFEEDDVCCLNSYPTWGHRQWGKDPAYLPQQGAQRWKDTLAVLHKQYPDKPILITEFGYPAIAGIHDGKVSEEEQSRAIEAEWHGILSQPYVAGATLWCWADHPWAEEDWLGRLTTSPFGVVGRDRKSKVALETVRRLFHSTNGSPSLLLRRSHLNGLPPVELPDGYTLRLANAFDADGLAACLQKAFPEMVWQAENARKALLEDTTVKSVFVIEHLGEIVATASSRLVPEDFPGSGYIHWVGTDPGHRGKNLGFLVSLATLHDFVRLGCRDSVLHTDDFRVPAIKVYLRLGFRPEYAHATHSSRWSRLAPSLPKIELP